MSRGIPFQKEHIPWNKGVTGYHLPGKPMTESHKFNLSQAKLGKPNLKLRGRKKSEETKEKLRLKARERYKNKGNHPRYGCHLSEETKQEIRIGVIEAWERKGENYFSVEGKKALISSSQNRKQSWSEESREQMALIHTKFFIIKEELEWLCKGQSLSSSQIAKLYNVSTSTVCSKRRELKIPYPDNKGERNSNWKGGISLLPYPFIFNGVIQGQIRERDNNICKLCGKLQSLESRKLSVHHIDYNKDNCQFNNLLTLCRRCNSLVNGNRPFWSNFLPQLIVPGALLNALTN